MRAPLPGLALCLILAGCVTPEAPKKTLAGLDVQDPLYATAGCEQARAAAGDYKEHPILRTAMGIGGNVVAPFAGTAAAMAVGNRLDKKKTTLNRRTAAACVSDPLGAAPAAGTP